MLYVSPTKGRSGDRDLLWYSLWCSKFKELHPKCVEISDPKWGMTKDYWTLIGISVLDGTMKYPVSLLFNDGRFGYKCVGFEFNGVVCERIILNGKDLISEILAYAKTSTQIRELLRSNSIEYRVSLVIERVIESAKVLTLFNRQVSPPFETIPVAISLESMALNASIISEELAKKGSRTVTFKVESSEFPCMDAFYQNFKAFVVRNFNTHIAKGVSETFKFNVSTRLEKNKLALIITIILN